MKKLALGLLLLAFTTLTGCAEAEARSIQLRSAALQSSPKLVEWEAVQKWNGELPTYVGAGTPVPFIDVK